MTPAGPRPALPGLARARGVHLGPRRDARRVRGALGAARRPRAPAHGALPAEARGGAGEPGEGGTIKFLKSDCEAESDGTKPILVAGEDAGLDLPFGCREGICHTCVGTLRSGKVRDLRNGKVYGQRRRDRSAPASTPPKGPVEIEL